MRDTSRSIRRSTGLSDLAAAVLSRRQLFRGAALLTAGAALPFPSEHVLAQLSDVGRLPDDAVKINANEFPEGPSPSALAALTAAAQQGNRYQYPATEALVATAAEVEQLPPASFAVYPGSSLALHHAVAALTSPKRALIVADPGYEAAAFATKLSGASVVRVPLRKDGAHDCKAMLRAARKQPTGVIYVCNPNNPTGTITPRSEIDALVAAKPAQTIVLIDEAYIHFSDEPPAVDLVRAGKDVVLLRTFSKVYGMAGLRAGFAITRPDLLARMTVFNAGAMPVTAMAAARAMLREPDLVRERKARNAVRRTELMRFFDAHGYGYTPSVSNTLMVDARMPTTTVIERLKERHVYVGRPWPVWPTHVRVTIGTEEEMARFQTAFLAVVESARS